MEKKGIIIMISVTEEKNFTHSRSEILKKKKKERKKEKEKQLGIEKYFLHLMKASIKT